MNNSFNHRLKIKNAFLLLFSITFIIYSNTFHVPFQFDDKPNIVDNKTIHIDKLSADAMWHAFFAKPGSNELYRPLPMLSFALNWFFGRTDTTGYHLFNIILHALNAFLLFLTTFALIQTPVAKKKYYTCDTLSIALLSATLWAINPIQTQAVTYIVQRMAAMAAMFYLLGIFSYIKARQASQRKTQLFFFMACFFSYVCAFLSKENAVILPVSLGLVEIIFFQNIAAWVHRRKHSIPILVGTGIVVVLVLVFILYKKYGFFIGGYETRPFSLKERLLTQPRVVLFYISQIFYPLPSRLSITHDLIVSKSLFSPWTTIPSMLVILALIVIGIFQIRKQIFLSFAILFFFVNHIIESSIIPLELIFEHRNYLPSLFLFLPIAAMLNYLITIYRKKNNRPMYVILTSFVTMIIIGWGCLTYLRNRDWRTETTLWADAMKKAPQNARPPWNLAIQIGWDKNIQSFQLDVALSLFKRALTLRQTNKFQKARILRNMGIIYYHRGDYEKAVRTYKRGLENNPSFTKLRFDLISALVMMGKWEEGLKQADLAKAKTREKYISSDYFKLKGFILLWQNRLEEALGYLRKALRVEPNNGAVLLNTGVALSLMGKTRNADLFLTAATRVSPEDIRPFYALIENSVREGSGKRTRKYVDQLFTRFSMQAIIKGIEAFSGNHRTAPMKADLIRPVIRRNLMQKSAEIEKLSFPACAD